MLQHLLRSTIAIVVAILAGMIFTCQAEAAGNACAQIRQACRAAGFVAGNNVKDDCLVPLLQGTPPPRSASKPLPSVDPQWVAACNVENPSLAAVKPTAPIVSASLAAQSTVAPNASGKPNIVFILADDFSTNLIAYMPNLQAMQKDGMTFSNYFVTDSLCCPSRTSIFTGKLPHNDGVLTNTPPFGGYAGFMEHGNEALTFALALQADGYKTAMLGKYLNGYKPDKSGVPPGWNEWAVAGDGYREFNYQLNRNGRLVAYGNDAPSYLTDVVSGLGNAFIRHAASGPFFIEIATFAPHGPFIPAPRDADKFPGLTAPPHTSL